MTRDEFLAILSGAMEDIGIPCMTTGSIGSMNYGEFRTTHDIDIVIDPTDGQLRALVERLSPSVFVQADAAMEAKRRQSMFSVMLPGLLLKADLIFRKNRPFSETEFSRRRTVELAPGLRISILSPEDSVLSKLEWSKMGESARHFEDALGVAVVQWGRLDGRPHECGRRPWKVARRHRAEERAVAQTAPVQGPKEPSSS